MSRFVHALRSADVAVSPAETLDALAVLQQVGVDNRRLLQDALRLTLAKTVEEKAAFDACFPAFFSGLPVREPPKRRLIGQVSREELQQAVAALAHAPLRDAVAFALNGDFTRLSRQVASLFDRGELDAMRHLRDKPVLVEKAAHALGLGLLAGLGGQGGAQGSAAMHLRQYLTGQLKAYVDLQYRLVVDASGQRALLAAALSANFQQLPPDYHVEMERVVCKLADRLARRHRRRRHDTQRGQLDLRRMLRRNVAYDGTPVNVYWRRRRREPATILLVCDVSNSVSQLARFLLLLLYRL
ncbi:MAG: VWA domain-containing protein, partial [Pseudomonadales bacterium]|nr:VWA domain-containing protein [Pseudomonadales bacterium]